MNLADNPQASAAPKGVRKFSIEGLPAREELVFKSLVRLLSHRGRFEWVYSPSSSELRVVADGSKPDPQGAQQTLTLGVHDVKRAGYLCMPLRATELEAELERLGALIRPARRLQSSPEAPGNMTPPAAAPTEPMRMLRWPPGWMLGQPGRLQLATWMTGKPMTVYALAQKSGESLAVCTAFFDDLTQAGLLASAIKVQTFQGADPTPQAKPAPQPHVAQLGLLSRIRMRLGLKAPDTGSRVSSA